MFPYGEISSVFSRTSATSLLRAAHGRLPNINPALPNQQVEDGQREAAYIRELAHYIYHCVWTYCNRHVFVTEGAELRGDLNQEHFFD